MSLLNEVDTVDYQDYQKWLNNLTLWYWLSSINPSESKNSPISNAKPSFLFSMKKQMLNETTYRRLMMIKQ